MRGGGYLQRRSIRNCYRDNCSVSSGSLGRSLGHYQDSYNDKRGGEGGRGGGGPIWCWIVNEDEVNEYS